MTETFQHATILPQISKYVDLIKLSKNHMSNYLYTDQFPWKLVPNLNFYQN